MTETKTAKYFVTYVGYDDVDDALSDMLDTQEQAEQWIRETIELNDWKEIAMLTSEQEEQYVAAESRRFHVVEVPPAEKKQYFVQLSCWRDNRVILGGFATSQEAHQALADYIYSDQKHTSYAQQFVLDHVLEQMCSYSVVMMYPSETEQVDVIPAYIKNKVARLNALLAQAAQLNSEIEEYLADSGVECPFDELSYSEGIIWPAYDTTVSAINDVLDSR